MIFPMYIDGKWFEGEGRQMQDVISPGSGEVLGRIPLGTPEDADAALQAAKKAAPALAAMSGRKSVTGLRTRSTKTKRSWQSC